jgi:hypothetical protein
MRGGLLLCDFILVYTVCPLFVGAFFSVGFGFQSVHTLASPGSASQTANMNINVSHRIRTILM